jgi:DNA-binding CsgD family transcriptional regulator
VSEWPFVARVDELRRGSQVLRPGSGFRGVVLVGEAGVGKTALARVLAENLESEGLTARFVLGTETGQAVPLGAFHRTLPVEDPHEPAVMLAPELETIIDAAAGAVTMSNLVLGEQLARFAYERGGGLPAAIVLADAISWQGRGQAAEAILAAFDPDGGDELTTVRWGCLRAANLYFGCGQGAAARAVLETVRDRVASEEMLSLVTAMEVSFAFFGADVPTAVSVGLAALDAEMMPIATVWAAMATAAALALSGRFAQVGAVARRGVQAAEGCESGPQRYTIGLAEVLGFTAAGNLDAAARACERYSAMTAGVAQAEAIVTALVGRVELARGRLTAAREALQTSLWTMSESLPAGWVMLVASWLAQTEAARGNGEDAAAALARAEDANGPQVAAFLPELELARSWGRAGAGETTAARDHALRAAQIARSAGMYAVELHTLHTAVRFGDRSQSGRLHQLAAQLKTPLAAAIAAHSRGMADHDGDRLDDAADRFHGIAAAAMAADASAHAAREHARASHRVKELESATRAHWQASQCDLRSPAVTATEDPLPLTDREREIASLVGAGLTSREIADRLSVSVRTVDGHLYRIYSKLRIEDRDQLARLVRVRHAT